MLGDKHFSDGLKKFQYQWWNDPAKNPTQTRYTRFLKQDYNESGFHKSLKGFEDTKKRLLKIKEWEDRNVSIL